MKKFTIEEEVQGILILIFVEGTILKPRKWWTLYNHKSYIPIGDAVSKTKLWKEKGANIVYCTSRKGKSAQTILNLLKEYGFSGSYLMAREKGEKYKDIVEKLSPQILVEDDCKSIGGAWQMCITKVNPDLRERITSLVVPEFIGIDHLSDTLDELLKK